MKFNILYLYRQSEWGKELKYSLRSVERYVNVDRVYIAGDKPQWAQNIVHICAEKLDRYDDVNNLFNKALDVIPEFENCLLMHDDMFLLEPYEPIRYYKGLMKDAHIGGDRKKLFDNMPDDGTRKNYAIHYPMPFYHTIVGRNTENISIMNQLGHLGEIDDRFPSKEVDKDCKFNAALLTEKHLQGMPCFSTYHEHHGDFESLLLKLYPKKSIFER